MGASPSTRLTRIVSTATTMASVARGETSENHDRPRSPLLE
jgi:hypothetical protein